MAGKRPRRDELTGGSKDVNPQTMTVNVIQPGADTTVSFAQQLPIPRLPTRPGYNLVIELLTVTLYWIQPILPAAGGRIVLAAGVTTRPNAPVNFLDQVTDPRKLALWYHTAAQAGGAGAYALNEEAMKVLDLTDQAGHGLLIATDVIYMQLQTAFTVQANDVVFELEYRWKEVTLVEYIGIVQSQQ